MFAWPEAGPQGVFHYLTRVADAFQLPLERDNVFQGKKQ
jgi:hypothetical protein